MGIAVQVNQATVRAAQRKLMQLKKDVPDLTVPHKQIAVFLDKWVKENFKSEGKKVGSWAPFARGGRWVKGKGIDPTAKLLDDTGDLKKSYSPFFDKKTAGIGSDLTYAKDHEEGIRSENLPRRRTLPRNREIRRDVNKIYDNWMRKTIRKRT